VLTHNAIKSNIQGFKQYILTERKREGKRKKKRKGREGGREYKLLFYYRARNPQKYAHVT
jgi:hypothetical protein